PLKATIQVSRAAPRLLASRTASTYGIAGCHPNGAKEAPYIRHLHTDALPVPHANFRSAPRSASTATAGIHPHESDGFLSHTSFPGAVTPEWHGDSARPAARVDGRPDVRHPTMTSVTASYRREAFASQAGAANNTRVRKRAYVRLLVGAD